MQKPGFVVRAMKLATTQGYYTLRQPEIGSTFRCRREPHPMSLVFSLLQKDYIIVAADSRHTRGDRSGGLYKNDQGLKTLEIQHGKAIFGFAGHDIGENILARA